MKELQKLKAEAREIAFIYYQGKFSDNPSGSEILRRIDSLLVGASKTSLTKDIRAMKKALKNVA